MEHRTRQYWAFLANPKVFRIREALRDLTYDSWTTKAADIRKGDRVLIWKAKGLDILPITCR